MKSLKSACLLFIMSMRVRGFKNELLSNSKTTKIPQGYLCVSFLIQINCLLGNISSGIRQKGESQNECFKKAKHAKISEKQTFLTSRYAHVRVRIRG